jgi:siroheme synthase
VTGIVYLVGAGPGDPEIMTLKGRRSLATAQVVAYDRLVAPEILDLIGAGALRISVGKGRRGTVDAADRDHRPARPPRTGRTNGRSAQGWRSVHLRAGGGHARPAHGGHPVRDRAWGLRGPGRACLHRHSGHPSRAGQERRVRDRPRRHDRRRPSDRLAGARRVDALVVFMAGRTAGDVARRLLDAGRPAATPAAIALDASLPGQEVRRAISPGSRNREQATSSVG